jgi:hypothetical protein
MNICVLAINGPVVMDNVSQVNIVFLFIQRRMDLVATTFENQGICVKLMLLFRCGLNIQSSPGIQPVYSVVVGSSRSMKRRIIGV